MKCTHTIALGIFAALMSSVALSAHAHPGGMAGMQGGMMAQMGQGLHSAGVQQSGSGAAHPGMGAGQQGMGGPGRGMASAQRGQAGEGPMAGGCPMTSQNSIQPSPTR